MAHLAVPHPRQAGHTCQQQASGKLAARIGGFLDLRQLLPQRQQAVPRRHNSTRPPEAKPAMLKPWAEDI
jgi:hypothetical protein